MSNTEMESCVYCKTTGPNKQIMIKFFGCGGIRDYLCPDCVKAGWISQAHIGGPIHYIMNTITDERFYKKQEIDEPF